ncbi:MAG: ABC transporter permease [Chitinophagaceae bacterium]
MFKNYFKAVFRSFRRNKVFSTINIVGLSIGLTSCLLIALYLLQQLSFDKFQQNGERIARVVMEYSFEGSDASQKGTFTSVRVAPVLKRTFPEVEDAVCIANGSLIIQQDNKPVREKNVLFADLSFLKMFSFKLLKGNRDKALAASHDVILTQSTAKKYFGDADPIGKTLHIANDSIPLNITGIIADCPGNSQIQFDFLASFATLGIPKERGNSYWDANYTTYLLLRDKSAINSLQAKLPNFMKKEMDGQHATVNFFLEPFDRIHLHSPYDAFVPNINISYIYILAAVALLILAIACFTYINLSTARSMERAKEVGIKKVVGANRKQLFWQFIGESAIVCTIAVLLGLFLSAILLPYFNQLTNQQLPISRLFSLPILTVALCMIIIVSFTAGSYPALILSAFQPVKVLKGAFKNSGSGQWLRKSLIVFQFIISVFLIFATFIVQQQLHYIQNRDLGYDRDHAIVVPVPWYLKNINLIKTELKQNPDVLNISHCHSTPVEINGGYNMRTPVMPENTQIAVNANNIDDEFLPASGLQLIAGTDLTAQDIKDADHDSGAVFHFVLNESAARQLGWSPQDAVGKKMFLGDDRPGYVRGVVKDFNFHSLHEAIKPLVLFSDAYGGSLLVRINGKNMPQTLSFLQSKWKTLMPDRPFEYRFLDDDYNKMYANEIRLGKIMNIFAGIAILLACAGLFGLSAYSVQQRVKEIGVRKVLGASVKDIVVVLSKEFVQLAFIAALIAFPIGWWAMHGWLQNYTYRISIHWWAFLLIAVCTVVIALLTVSFQTVRAARANPVKSLRTE